MSICPSFRFERSMFCTWVLSHTCDVDRDDSSCDRLRLLPHPLLWCWEPGRRLHLHLRLRLRPRLVRRAIVVPAGGVVDGVEDQWGHGPSVVQVRLVLI